MWSLVEQHTTAFSFPGAPPRARPVVGIRSPSGFHHDTTINGSHLAAVEELFRILIRGLKSRLMNSRQKPPGGRSYRQQTISLFYGNSERFFTDDVYTLLQRKRGQIRVEPVRSGYDSDVD